MILSKRREDIVRIGLVKIDVEGAEKEVLEGGRETFKNKVDNVFVEISPHRHAARSTEHMVDIFTFFKECGFIFIDKYGDYFFSKEPLLLKRHFRTY